ncbi:pilus assembly protein TadG-related protein [Catenuloplanes sp. NPDC051500]|uniref:pilus assembly protein TadG-related protein n=1 Tax=Catenuloplanes sp. NPDC051500 TaxID=3363959 RepID=UPI003799CBDE
MTTLVAVLLTTGVLLGMGALVIDVGRIYGEREELLSGADAAAWAVANQCSVAAIACTAYAASAQSYAALNASDATVTVSRICGFNPKASAAANTAQACPAVNGGLTQCLGTRPTDLTLGWVEVWTSTKNPDGSTLLPPVFARALAGGTSNNGTAVGACSRVRWTPINLTNINVVTLAVAACAWNTSAPVGLQFRGSVAYTGCGTAAGGGGSMGGFSTFGLLSGLLTCTTTLNLPIYKTALSLLNGCGTVITNSVGATLTMPVYNDIDPVLGFRLVGFTQFKLANYCIAGVGNGVPAGSGLTCTALGGQTWIYGSFSRSIPGSYGVTNLKRDG